MSIFRSRATAVVAGAATVVALGATTAVAGDLIGTRDVKDNSLRSADVRDGTLKMRDFTERVQGKINKRGPKGEQGPGGLYALESAALTTPVTIAHIGGPINNNYTDLETGVTLPAGKYLVTVDGTFIRDVDAALPAVDVWPQLSLWLDKNHDDAFTWQDGEGDISPNALMPTVKDRHISVSGSSIVTLTEETDVNLLAFGYAADQSSKRSGEISVLGATITATPLP